MAPEGGTPQTRRPRPRHDAAVAVIGGRAFPQPALSLTPRDASEPAPGPEACAGLALCTRRRLAAILFRRLRCYGRFQPFTVSESGSMKSARFPPGGPAAPASNQIAGHDARILGAKLREIASVVFSPSEAKTLRRFTSARSPASSA